MIAFAVIAALGAAAMAVSCRGLTGNEQRLVTYSYFIHVFAAVAQVLLTNYYFGGGDMNGYHKQGVFIASVLEYDFGTFAPEVLKLIMKDETSVIPGNHYMRGSSTGSITGIAAFVFFFVGDSLYAGCLFVAVFSALAKIALYRGLRLRLAPEMHQPALFACLLVPSLIYWTSGLVKETIAVTGFGFMAFGVARLADRRPSGMLFTVAGGYVVYLIKPYILAAFAAALPIWVLTAQIHRRHGGLKKRHLLTAVWLAVVGVLLAGQIMPEFAVGELTDKLENLQNVGGRISGGSNYSLAAGAEGGFATQVLLAPLGLFSSLFRPLPVEARSFMVVVNSLETFAFTCLFFWSVFKLGGRRALDAIAGSPEMIASAVFVCIFGAAVGLASTNLGSLSRYRAPMLPFWIFLVLELRRRAKLGHGEEEPEPSEGAVPPPAREVPA